MRILFIIPNLSGDFQKAMHPHIGVGYMVAMLKKHNHNSEAIDLRIESKLKSLDKKVRFFNPEIIGTTFMTRDYKKAYKFVNFLKQRYKRKIIIGGPHPSLFQEETLKGCNADYAIVGEGEYAILALANKEPPKKIKNLIWKDGEKIIKNKTEVIDNLDALPFPAYDKNSLKKYVDKKIPLVTSRGCPFSCVYCSIKNVMGKKWRPRSAENIIEEIENWKANGYNFFHIADDNFALDRERVKKVCNLLIGKKLNINWDLRNGIRADTVDEELLRLMKKAGCEYVSYGIESVDQEVLDASKKGLKVETIEKAVYASLKVGIRTGASFIIGLPKDNFTKFNKLLRFINKYNFEEALIYNCVPYPKTELEIWIKKNGRYLSSPEEYLNYASYWQNKVLFETPEFSAAERTKAFQIAETVVWKKLLRKELGYLLSTIAYPFWINPTLRKAFIKPGLALWVVLRKIRGKKKYYTQNGQA
ncbi:MAG: radical SAM protein [Nanoarchaeota archaeon]